MAKIITIIISLLTFFLSSCASFNRPLVSSPPPVKKIVNHYLPWAQRKTQLNAIKNWHVNGNLAAHNQQHKGINASFSWEQHNNAYQLSFFGPLGSSSAVLNGNANGISLVTHQQTYTAKNPEQLLQNQLGFRLPVSQLYYWIRGLPAPQSRYTVNLDAYNRLLKLRQSGWHINYLHYTNSETIDLPDLLVIANGAWQIRIAMTHWDISQ